MTNAKLVKLFVAAGIAFSVTACGEERDAKILDLAIANTKSKSLVDQGVGHAMAEEVSTSQARIGRDVRAVSVGQQFNQCKSKRQMIDGQSVVVFDPSACLFITSRAETANAKPSDPAPR